MDWPPRYQTLKALAGAVQVWNIPIARGIEQMDRLRFEAITPRSSWPSPRPPTRAIEPTARGDPAWFVVKSVTNGLHTVKIEGPGRIVIVTQPVDGGTEGVWPNARETGSST